jgi:hypothetical protein
MSKFIALTLLLSAAAVSACGKDDPITAIDRSMDCSEICGRYKDCLAMDYDTSKCEDRCTDMVDKKQTDQIDTCQECIDGKSCTNSVFNCTSECVGIVP